MTVRNNNRDLLTVLLLILGVIALVFVLFFSPDPWYKAMSCVGIALAAIRILMLALV